jgi:hypothetical protein
VSLPLFINHVKPFVTEKINFRNYTLPAEDPAVLVGREGPAASSAEAMKGRRTKFVFGPSSQSNKKELDRAGSRGYY